MVNKKLKRTRSLRSRFITSSCSVMTDRLVFARIRPLLQIYLRSRSFTRVPFGLLPLLTGRTVLPRPSQCRTAEPNAMLFTEVSVLACAVDLIRLHDGRIVAEATFHLRQTSRHLLRRFIRIRRSAYSSVGSFDSEYFPFRMRSAMTLASL